MHNVCVCWYEPTLLACMYTCIKINIDHEFEVLTHARLFLQVVASPHTPYAWGVASGPGHLRLDPTQCSLDTTRTCRVPGIICSQLTPKPTQTPALT